MIDSLPELRQLLASTPLAIARITALKVPDTGEWVFAIGVGANGVAAWTQLREMLPQTGRWPVLTNLWSSTGGSWADEVRDADLFSRFYFKEERTQRKGDDPKAVLAAAAVVDVAAALVEADNDDSVSNEECLEYSIEQTAQRFGNSPVTGRPIEFLAKHHLTCTREIEKWLFDWELANCPDPLAFAEGDLGHIGWFEPDEGSQVLLLMPSDRGWEVPAYLNWFASSRANSETIVSLLRQWHEEYGAELVAHFGTMLQLRITRRPASAEEAFELAWQQQTIAPCTTNLPGVALRDHARALLHTDRWFLHERP